MSSAVLALSAARNTGARRIPGDEKREDRGKAKRSHGLGLSFFAAHGGCTARQGRSGRFSGPSHRKSGSSKPLKWPRSFEQNFRVVKWIVGRGLCCRAERQRVRVGLIRGAAVKGCVRSPCVVEGDVAAD